MMFECGDPGHIAVNGFGRYGKPFLTAGQLILEDALDGAFNAFSFIYGTLVLLEDLSGGIVGLIGRHAFTKIGCDTNLGIGSIGLDVDMSIAHGVAVCIGNDAGMIHG